MNKLIENSIKSKHLVTGERNGKTILHFCKPCKISFDGNAYSFFKNEYIPNEEIGGYFWAKPSLDGFNIIKISKIRNAIEDTNNYPTHNKNNAYLTDTIEKEAVLKEILEANCLPIPFHTHPTYSNNILNETLNYTNQTNISEQDKRESECILSIEGCDFLLPRALVVGNVSSDTYFVGIYNGNISQLDFQPIKENVVQNNINDFANKIKNSNTKYLIGFIAVIAIIAILAFRYPKQVIPILLILSVFINIILQIPKSETSYTILSPSDSTIKI